MRFARAPLALVAGAVFLLMAADALADGFTPAQIIRAIKEEINEARLAKAPESYPLKITAVEVVLTALIRKDTSGSLTLEIPVFEAGAGIGSKVGNKQTITLRLKPLGEPVEVSGSGNFGLVPAIEKVKIALREAARGRPRFALDEFVFDIEFVVSKNSKGEIRFFFIDAGMSYEETVTQRVTIHMESSPK